MAELKEILDKQLAYYADRAREYDEWWERRGRYQEGQEKDSKWQEDVKAAKEIVSNWISKDSQVLELACGTGIWTKVLAETVDVEKLDCVDGNKETIEVLKWKFNNAGLGNKLPGIGFDVADIFGDWQPKSGYSVIFMGFFLTHVPPSKLDGFVEKLKKAVLGSQKKKAQIVIIDSYYECDVRASAKDYSLREGIKAIDYEANQPDEKFLIYRKLNSGAVHPIVKVFYDHNVLLDVFAKYGIRGETKLVPNKNFLLANLFIE